MIVYCFHHTLARIAESPVCARQHHAEQCHVRRVRTDEGKVLLPILHLFTTVFSTKINTKLTFSLSLHRSVVVVNLVDALGLVDQAEIILFAHHFGCARGGEGLTVRRKGEKGMEKKNE
jgi:hypothetical protein